MNLEMVVHNLINQKNQNITITDSKIAIGKSINLNGEKLSDVFHISKINKLQEVIDFFNINKFLFDIENTTKIDFIENGKIISFHFESFFSSKVILQYDIKIDKFKIFIDGNIIGIDKNSLSLNMFNFMCYKISENNKVHNNFAIKYSELKLNYVKTFLTENSIPFSDFSQGHLSMIEIVKY